jgi:ABC-type amino acid transport substrate-binding protein
MRRKYLALATIASLLLSACDTQSPTQTPGPDTGPAAYRLATPGTLTIGFAAAQGLIETKDGQVVGQTKIVDDYVANKLGLTPKYVEMDFAAILPALLSHRIDLFGQIASSTQTRAQVAFPEMPNIYFGTQTLIVKKDVQPVITSWEEAAAKGLTLAGVQGHLELDPWKQLGIKVHIFADENACMTDVLNGGAYGCSIGSFQIPYMQATDPSNPLAALAQIPMTGPLENVDTGLMYVAKDNAALAWDVSQALTDAWRDGTIVNSYKAIFGSADASVFYTAPESAIAYKPGAWETGTTPPPPTTFPSVTTISSKTLTVGVPANTPMLSLSDGTLSGPEAAILTYAAQKLGLTIKAVSVTDEAGALNGDQVDVIAGVPTTVDRTNQYWMTGPIGFSPDYMYVNQQEGGGLPAYASWGDVKEAGLPIAIMADDPRAGDLQQAGVQVVTFPTAGAALDAVLSGEAGVFVGASPVFTSAVSADPALQTAGFGFLRNKNSYEKGIAYAWGVKAGNATLVDALDQAIDMAWLDQTIHDAYTKAWPGADTTALEAPGPTLIGTSYGASKDYEIRNMWISGAWLQGPKQ